VDFKFAVRSLFKSPGFTILAVLVLGLGIGANSAIFSVINAVILQPLPYKDPGRIVNIANFWKSATGRSITVSAPDFHDWEKQNTVFESMAYWWGGETNVLAGSQPDYALARYVSRNFFHVLGSDTVIGRLFNAEESKLNGPNAVVISYGFWQRNFAGNPNALGKTVKADGKIYSVVGVMPAGFQFPGKSDLWFPSMIEEETKSRTAHNYRTVARLKDGVSLQQAQTQMDAIATRLAQQYPNDNKTKGVSVMLLQDQLISNIRQTLYYLVGAVALVLLIACANVANLLLARASGRTREIAIRSAIGASRWRIFQQLITEGVVLSVLSGIVGVLFALWGKDALLALAPKNLPRLDEVRIDGWVMSFTFLVSVVSSLLFGIFPAVTASRVDLNEALKQGGTRTVIGGGSGRLRQGIVIVEIALSVVLVAAAGLLIRSFASLTSSDVGFPADRLLVMQTSVGATDKEAAIKTGFFYRDLVQRLATAPNVTSVTASSFLPGATGSNGGYYLEGGKTFKELGMANTPQAIFSPVAPGYFKTLGLQLKSGRDFDERDLYEAKPVAIINEALARKSFQGVDPIGRGIACGMDRPDYMTIVGVVSDIRQQGPGSKPQPELYMPAYQHPMYATAMNVIVRTNSDPTALTETMRRKTRELNPEVPVKFTSVEETLSSTIAVPRFRTTLIGVFAALALCLAMAGIYGVMAFLVNQRTAEIGIRMALGASRGNVLGMILQHGGQLAAIGLAIGFAASFAVNRTLESFLYEVRATDAMTYALVGALMIFVVLAACIVPAMRASRLDPLIALRQE